MKIIILSIVALLVLSSFKMFGQTLGQKWEKVFEDAEQTIYVDTSTIKQIENQISLLSAKYYKTPLIITSLNKEAGSVKSQLLFNSTSKKFTIIGTLYYDKNLKILGETALPGFASGSEVFSVPLEGNEIMTSIYNMAVKYLNSGLSVIEKKDIPKSGEKNKDLLASNKKKNSKVEIEKPVENDSIKALERVSLYLSKRDSVQKAETLVGQSNAKISSDTPKRGNEVSQSPLTEKKKTIVDRKESGVDGGIETNPKSNIFKIGMKYSFQVSSWKNKTKAESEVIKLKREGHTAFLSEGSVYGQTRYRVRIGYFNSLEEAEQYMKRLK